MKTRKESRIFAYSLVSEGKNDITKLTSSDKEELTSHIIDSYDKYNAYEFIGEAADSNEYAYMLARYMRTRKIDDGLELLDLMIKGAVEIAGNEIVDLLIEQQEEFNFNIKYETGNLL